MVLKADVEKLRLFNLMPKDTSLFDQIEQLTDLAAAQITRLGAILDCSPDSKTLATDIEKDRHLAHGLSREVLRRLDAAFITPFDREDIFEIGNGLYRVTDRVATTAERIELYRMREIHPSLQGQCKTLNAMASEYAWRCISSGQGGALPKRANNWMRSAALRNRHGRFPRVFFQNSIKVLQTYLN